MSERGPALLQSSDAALLDKIEQLSLLRSLSDRLAQARDFASACRTLVQVVWEEACQPAPIHIPCAKAHRKTNGMAI